MNTIRLLFTTRRAPGSALIRFGTWSRWSHVALVDDDHVIESVFRHGVRRIPRDKAIEKASRAVVVALPARNPERILAAARSQIGKPYDWTAIVGGFVLRRRWQEDDAWFCSELVAWAFHEAGEALFRADALCRVSPEHLYMLHPASTGREIRNGGVM